MSVVVRPLSATEARAQREPLAALLVACVEGGAGVSFLAPLPLEQARAFWDGVAKAVEHDGVVLLAAFAGEDLIGTVQVCPVLKPNQPHRAELAKMLVAPAARRQGVGAALLAAAEEAARGLGRTLLVLDTVAGSAADRLYRRAGWHAAGTIPGFALDPFGAPDDATVFWKRLDAPPRHRPAPDVMVRAAEERDLAAILAIYNDAVRTTTAIWNDTPVDLAERRAWWQARRATGYPVLVAVAAGEVAGYGSFGPFRPFEGYRDTVEHSLYVRASQRGGGIGRLLLAALEREARALGKHTMVGGIAADNTASLRLHAAAGFVEVGRLREVGVKFGRRLDLVFAHKRLG